MGFVDSSVSTTLTLSGFNGGVEEGTVNFYLADYRGTTTSDYIVYQWTHVDFSQLGTVDELRFTMTSSDNEEFGMNTPAYFAMDNLVVPEPGSVMFIVCGGMGLMARRRR